MARAKYKIGQLIRTRETDEVNATTGLVTGVVQREDGYSYEVQGSDDEVNEGDVDAVFRPVVPRQSKPRTAKGSRKSAKTEARAAA